MQNHNSKQTDQQKKRAAEIKALKPDYAQFLRSNGGKDFLAQAEKMQQAAILLGIKAETNDEKAAAVSVCEGITRLRDYVHRMSKG